MIQNLSIGASANFDYLGQPGKRILSVGGGPRVGCNIGITDKLSLWLRAGVDYAHFSVKDSRSDAAGKASREFDVLALTMYAPVVLEPVPHFILGFGPSLSTDLLSKIEGVDNIQVTTIGARFVVGGWL